MVTGVNYFFSSETIVAHQSCLVPEYGIRLFCFRRPLYAAGGREPDEVICFDLVAIFLSISLSGKNGKNVT
jgi:hypothetical protein